MFIFLSLTIQIFYYFYFYEFNSNPIFADILRETPLHTFHFRPRGIIFLLILAFPLLAFAQLVFDLFLTPALTSTLISRELLCYSWNGTSRVLFLAGRN